jgi:hypothetical protein
MTLDQPHRARRTALATAIACSTIATVVPLSHAAAAPPPCGALGGLFEYDLNDRCDFNTGLPDAMQVEPKDVVIGLSKAGLFATTVPCRDGSEAFVVARPDELIVSAPNLGLLTEALAQVRQRLGSSFVAARLINGLAARVRVQPGTINDAFLVDKIPSLQGVTFSTDLNYLEPAQPNNGFRPGGNPSEAEAEKGGAGGGERSVLVLDSPAEPGRYPDPDPDPDPFAVTSSAGPSAVYDVDGNGKIDEDHGHGVFVASLIKRLAPDAEVVLYGVDGGQVPGSARWSPMMFSDADLIRSMGAAFGLSPLGTATRRTFDVVNLSLGGSGCGGVASRLGLGRYMRDLAVVASQLGRQPTYVAAAGNDGGDVKHFPAAFRDRPTMRAAALAIDAAEGVSPSPEGDAVRLLSAQLARLVVAVGSWTSGTRDPFSNCGKWVDAIAGGSDAVSRYPSRTYWAKWSGTSFATPQVSATLVGGATSGVTIADGIGAC